MPWLRVVVEEEGEGPQARRASGVRCNGAAEHLECKLANRLRWPLRCLRACQRAHCLPCTALAQPCLPA